MDDNNYSVVLCDTDKSKNINYQIRYQVYCLEAGYEAANKYPTLMETDYYDEFSAHFLILDDNTDSWIGACRLIILPFDELPLLQNSPIEDVSVYQHLPISAEISRLCVVTASRKGTRAIMEKMLKALYQYCLNHDIQHCFSLHSKAMARVVRSLNIHAQAISQDCDFHGQRCAYYHSITPLHVEPIDVQNQIKQIDNPLYQLYSEYKRQHKLFLNHNKKGYDNHAPT